jgi:hypothetical protein
MAKIKSDEMKSKQREKRRKCRTTTKLDKDLSGVLKKLKINGIGNAVKASVKKFLDCFDFDNNKDNLMKKYLQNFKKRNGKDTNPFAGGEPRLALKALAYAEHIKSQNYGEISLVRFKNFFVIY